MSIKEKPAKGSNQDFKAFKSISRTHKELISQRSNCGIGLIEWCKLKMAGKKDGTNGLPKEITENVWMSVFMDKEYNGFQEKCARLWGIQQSTLEGLFAEEGKLLDRIHYAQEKYRTSGLGKMEKNEAEQMRQRKSGEEHLSDDIISQRRMRELNKKNREANAAREAYKRQLQQAYEKLIDISNMIDESNNSAIMCSQRLSEHYSQRMDVYWRAAIFVHPGKKLMPVIPDMCFVDSERERYFANHHELTQAVEMAIRRYRREYGLEDSACGQKKENIYDNI